MPEASTEKPQQLYQEVLSDLGKIEATHQIAHLQRLNIIERFFARLHSVPLKTVEYYRYQLERWSIAESKVMRLDYNPFLEEINRMAD